MTISHSQCGVWGKIIASVSDVGHQQRNTVMLACSLLCLLLSLFICVRGHSFMAAFIRNPWFHCGPFICHMHSCCMCASLAGTHLCVYDGARVWRVWWTTKHHASPVPTNKAQIKVWAVVNECLQLENKILGWTKFQYNEVKCRFNYFLISRFNCIWYLVCMPWCVLCALCISKACYRC